MPKKFNYRLQKLLEIKKVYEKLAMNSVMMKEKEIQEKIQKITNLYKDISDSRAASNQIGISGKPAKISENQMRDELIRTSQIKITQIESLLEEDLASKAELNKVYEFALREVKKVDKHKENQKKDHKKAVNKKLESELEDLIQMRRKKEA